MTLSELCLLYHHRTFLTKDQQARNASLCRCKVVTYMKPVLVYQYFKKRLVRYNDLLIKCLKLRYNTSLCIVFSVFSKCFIKDQRLSPKLLLSLHISRTMHFLYYFLVINRLSDPDYINSFTVRFFPSRPLFIVQFLFCRAIFHVRTGWVLLFVLQLIALLFVFPIDNRYEYILMHFKGSTDLVNSAT